MSSVKSTEMTGGCLCGGVRYRITGPVRPIRYCHCSQCRRTSGHFVAATAVKTEELIFETNKSLAWFDSSEFASRGFCVRCGSSLFWKSKNRETISIMAGTLDHSHGLELADHIFVNDKADYYELMDDLPKIPQASSSQA